MESLRKLLEKVVTQKPTRISLRIESGESWDTSTSEVETARFGEPSVKTLFKRPISFTEFGEAVKEAFANAYGELKIVPISLREELLVNDTVMLRYTPTGSRGIFDIYITYKEQEYE